MLGYVRVNMREYMETDGWFCVEVSFVVKVEVGKIRVRRWGL